MRFFGSIDLGRRALAARQALDVAGNDIANVNTGARIGQRSLFDFIA